MRKLKLDIQALEVESFSVSSPVAGGRTVQGRAVIQPTNGTCIDCVEGGTWTCIGPTYCCPATWQQTCNASCYFTECGWYCGLVTGNTCESCRTCENQASCGAAGTCLQNTVCGPL